MSELLLKADGTPDLRQTQFVMGTPNRVEQSRRAKLYAEQMTTPQGESAINPRTGDLRDGFVGIQYEPFQTDLVDLDAVKALIGG